mmetsp:Transcript_8166/g.9334  ORF Transcript_8166/g.9334 Transcript_8166/m.9334 type:complete len:88 (-) Transcript_8166:140-403(-)
MTFLNSAICLFRIDLFEYSLVKKLCSGAIKTLAFKKSYPGGQKVSKKSYNNKLSPFLGSCAEIDRKQGRVANLRQGKSKTDGSTASC